LKLNSKTHKIYYSLHNNALTTLYKKPIIVDRSIKIKAAIYNTQKRNLGNFFEEEINLHKAIGSKISLNIPPNEAYDEEENRL
jgi:hypothetical protein